MKKTIITMFAFLVLFGFAVSGAFAQVTWSGPYLVTPPTSQDATKYEHIDYYSEYSVLTGLDDKGNLAQVFFATDPETAAVIIHDSAIADPLIKSIVAPPVGTEYGIDANTVVIWNGDEYVALDPQPPVLNSDDEFKSIAVGSDGALYVLFETTPNAEDPVDQYILVGDTNWEKVTVRFAPRSLNLGSKGRWVTCKISGFPQDEENAYTPADINLDNLCIVSINDQLLETPICRDANGPANNRNKKKLMVKFDRQALATGITALYTADPDNFDLTSVKITVSGYGLDESLQFYGEDIIKTKPAKVKKLKKK